MTNEELLEALIALVDDGSGRPPLEMARDRLLRPEAALISAAKEYVAAFYENNPGENKCSCRQCQATMALVRAVREAEALPQDSSP